LTTMTEQQQQNDAAYNSDVSVATNLAEACQAGDVPRMLSLLQKGDGDGGNGENDVSDLLVRGPIRWTDSDGKEFVTPPIFIAVDYGHLDAAKALLDYRHSTAACDDIADENGYAPIHWASWDGNLEMVKLLLERGNARVDQEAVDLAKEYGHSEVATFLSERLLGLGDDNDLLYSDIDPSDVDAIMLKASRVGDVRKVQQLIDEGYDFKRWKEEEVGGGGERDASSAAAETMTYKQYSPMFVALKNGHVDVLQKFIEAGVEIELDSESNQQQQRQQQEGVTRIEEENEEE